jgi:EmrB/QacA subfamily drug resistance transporter
MTPAYPHRWKAMFVLLAASFMNLLDVSIVNVALPNLQSDLVANDRELEWIVEIYILVYALCLLPFGRLGDIVGRKGMFIAGVIGFGVASALCGAAPSIGWLVLARGVQGMTAAMMSPQVMAIATTLFAPPERPKAFSLFGLVAGISGVAGPVASGLLLHADFFHLGWRLVFLVNVPIAVATVAVAAVRVPRLEPHPGLKNDWLGIVLSVAAISCLVYPLVEGRANGWPAWSFAAIACALVLLAAFTAWESRRARLGQSALLPMMLLSNRDYLVGVGAILVFFSALQGFFLVYAVFLQQGFGFTPLQAGLSTAPFPIGLLIATVVGARVPDLRLKILTGSLLLVIAFAVLGLLVRNATGADIGPASLALPLLIGGAGAGWCISSLFQSVMRTVPLKDAGAGSAAMQVIQQVGAVVGIALVSALFFSAVDNPGGPHPQEAFKDGFMHTVAYEVAAYLLVGAAALAMKFAPPAHAGARRPVTDRS